MEKIMLHEYPEVQSALRTWPFLPYSFFGNGAPYNIGGGKPCQEGVRLRCVDNTIASHSCFCTD